MMTSIGSSSAGSAPIPSTGSLTNGSADTVARQPGLSGRPVSVAGDSQSPSTMRRKPSPLWSQHEWSARGSPQAVSGTPVLSAGLSSGSTTDSDSSTYLATPRTPAGSSHFSTDTSPRVVQNQQYRLPVDLPLYPEEKAASENYASIRKPPTIGTRTSSINTEAHRTGSHEQPTRENKAAQKHHYIRATRSSPTIPSTEAKTPELLVASASSTGVGPTREVSTSGLGIQGVFDQGVNGEGLHRTESKALPPVPLSRSTTGVAGGPPPLPTSRVTDTAWKTYKPKKIKQEFSVDQLVDPMKLWEASHCYVTDEFGRKRRFGEFFDASPESQAPLGRHPPSRSSSRSGLSRYSSIAESVGSKTRRVCGGEEWNAPGRKTVVFFIRHFWCGQCQDFTFASISLLDPQAISAAGINVIVISNGTWRIIKRYRELFKCPYPIYVDETRQVYEKMGMVLLTNDFGPMFNDRAAYNQRSAPSQLVHGLKKAFMDMPLGNPGKLTQLGGEFVISSQNGLQCHFAHRMTNTSNHMEAFDVLQLAGCDKPTTDEQRIRKFAAAELAEIEQLQREEEEWKEGRTEEIERIQRSRAVRRQHLAAAEQQYMESSIRRLSIPIESQEDMDPTEVFHSLDASRDGLQAIPEGRKSEIGL